MLPHYSNEGTLLCPGLIRLGDMFAFPAIGRKWLLCDAERSEVRAEQSALGAINRPLQGAGFGGS
jgi:hypothetical protein